MHIITRYCGEQQTSHSCECLQVLQCRRQDVPANIGAAHMAVPLMARLDADMLAKAHNLKVILQYGVGVEGIDIPAVSSYLPPPGSLQEQYLKSLHKISHFSCLHVRCVT